MRRNDNTSGGARGSKRAIPAPGILAIAAVIGCLAIGCARADRTADQGATATTALGGALAGARPPTFAWKSS